MSGYLRRSRAGGERRWPIRTGRSDRPVVQLPSVALRVVLVGAVAVALIGVIVFRLWFLQILSAQQYVAQANDNRLRSVAVLAPRGTILDRSGAVMVDNRPGLAVGIRPMDVPAGQLPPLIARLAPLLRMKPAAIRSEIVHQVGVPWSQVKHGLGLQYDFVTVKQDTDRRTVSYLLEHTLSYPGVEVRQNYLRDYPMGDLGAHFLGYLGEIDQKELTEPQYRGYTAGDVVGQSGVEYTYDKWLRGVDGAVRVEVDASGRPKQVVAGGTLPQTGDNLQLSIDSRVQRAAENAVDYGINLAHANNELRADGGAAVVLDVHTGEVIAMASEPNFDPAWFVGGLSTKHWNKLNVKTTPLLDRTIQGQYAMGSTFKVVDAIAGLENGVITAGTAYDCTGAYTPPHTLDKAVWHCWIYPGAHGSLDLTQAIVQSCDVYFYNVGYDFYSHKGEGLEDWAKRLGMGHPTGIDLPGEVAGLVPTPGVEERYDLQGLQEDVSERLAHRPPLEARRLDQSGDRPGQPRGDPDAGRRDLRRHRQRRLPRDAAPRREGRRLAGQARAPPAVPAAAPPGHLGEHHRHRAERAPRSRRRRRPARRIRCSVTTRCAVAGKTGTAQVAGQGDYAWYCSYAPANDPQYVVVVMIQQGGHGGVSAAPAARMIYDSLFHVSGGQVTGAVHSD